MSPEECFVLTEQFSEGLAEPFEPSGGRAFV